MRSALARHDGRFTAFDTGDLALGKSVKLPEGPIDPLIKEAQLARGLFAEQFAAAPQPQPEPEKSKEPPAPAIDPERIRAAVTLALDAALPTMIQEITERVLIALGH